MMSSPPLLAVTIAAVLLAPPTFSQPTSAPQLPPAASPEMLTAPWPAPADARQREATQRFARIEQLRRGNRVVEIRVSDATGDHRYTMINREGRPPLSTQELSSGLSTPQFFKIDF